MDGNGRWAERRGQPRTAGHTEGEENLARLVRVAVRRNIGWLTVFGFSTENWMRPPTEVRHILGLHKKLFGRVAELNELNVRIQWIGRPFDSPAARTPKLIQRAIRKAIADTSANTGMLLTVAFDYGTRVELLDAVTPPPRRRQPGHARRRSTASSTSPSCRRSTSSCAPAARAVSPTSCCGRRQGRRCTSPTRTGPTSTAPSSTPRMALAVVNADERPPSLAAVTAALPAAEERPGQQRMAELVEAAIDARPPPRRAGGHRHRQDARLPRAGDPLGQARGRRHRDQGAAGPARRQGPAVPRRRAVRRRSSGPCSKVAATTSACSGSAS